MAGKWIETQLYEIAAKCDRAFAMGAVLAPTYKKK